MKPLRKASDDACLEAARDILGAVPEVMYYLRSAARCGKSHGLTIPQIRTLVYLDLHPQTTLSSVADCLGVTLPTASRLVDTLATRKMIVRHADTRDRRNVCLCLTPLGQRELAKARVWGRQHIAGPLRTLSEQQVAQIRSTMQVLQTLFCRPQPPRPATCQRETKASSTR